MYLNVYGKKGSSTKLAIQFVDPIDPSWFLMQSPMYSPLSVVKSPDEPNGRDPADAGTSHTPWATRGRSGLTFQLLELPVQPEQRRSDDRHVSSCFVQTRKRESAIFSEDMGLWWIVASHRACSFSRLQYWLPLGNLARKRYQSIPWSNRFETCPFEEQEHYLPGCCVSGSKWNSGRRRCSCREHLATGVVWNISVRDTAGGPAGLCNLLEQAHGLAKCHLDLVFTQNFEHSSWLKPRGLLGCHFLFRGWFVGSSTISTWLLLPRTNALPKHCPMSWAMIENLLKDICWLYLYFPMIPNDPRRPEYMSYTWRTPLFQALMRFHPFFWPGSMYIFPAKRPLKKWQPPPPEIERFNFPLLLTIFRQGLPNLSLRVALAVRHKEAMFLWWNLRIVGFWALNQLWSCCTK